MPGRKRAQRAFESVGPLLLKRKLVELDPDAPGILDHLAASQCDDGGWTFNWLAWSPAAAADWRGGS